MINVILVDDEMPALNVFMSNVMDSNKIGYQVFNKYPLQAVEYVVQNKTDLAFLDIDMPQINGVDLAMLLIERSPSIKIVFITGYAYDKDIIARRLGDNLLGYCHKPYASDQVIDFIEKVEMAKESNAITIKTKGSFDIFINRVAVRFPCAKAKELLALLVYKDGSTLSIDELSCYLWQDRDGERAKRMCRDAVWKLKQTLGSYNLEKIVVFGRGTLALCKADIRSSDSWAANKAALSDVGDDYLCQYIGDWIIYE